MTLPIDELLPEIVAHLGRGQRLVLRAAPGAGKTTRVPAALLDAGLAHGRAVVVLEPRRVAARAAADFVARQRGGPVGGEVGYRVRFARRGGAATKLWFVTEGVFGRTLVRDPFIEEAGIVVLDEFHERHLQSDLALAVVRELQESVRPDLKLVVMSATLETDRLAHYLGASVVTSEGRAYPVSIEHVPALDRRPLAARVAESVGRVAADVTRGDVLVFLPGLGEIRRAADALASVAAARGLDVVPLHGELPLEAQARALVSSGRRRVVLATNVAETALTVEGVTDVIDSGLARTARFDPRRGINTLRVAPISRAAAEQRAGRAGRTAPGRCLRMWSRGEHAGRRAHDLPEILRLDLAHTLLALRAWDLRPFDQLRWLDPPPAPAVAHAERLLLLLGALDEAGALTETGRRMLALPVEPRIARMLVETEGHGADPTGAVLAALASERDVLRTGLGVATDRGTGSSDLLLRAEVLGEGARHGLGAATCAALGIDVGAARAVERTFGHLSRMLRGAAPREHRSSRVVSLADVVLDDEVARRCVLAGFPDRVARRRSPGSPRALMVGGTGVALAPSSVVRDAELFVAVEVEAGTGPEASVRVASAIDRDWLATHSDHAFVFDDERERVVERRCERYHDLVLAESVRTDVDTGAASVVLAEVARADPWRVAKPDRPASAFLARVRFLHRWMPELALPADTDDLLRQAVVALTAGCRSLADLRAGDLVSALQATLTPRQRHALEREAPLRWRLPSGREAPVSYDPEKPPAVAARIQEVFGLRATPKLAGNRVPLVLQLLAPNQRPVQITDDLESFWRTTYPEVRKVLRGRYPKHAWPEDPHGATPTRGRGRG